MTDLVDNFPEADADPIDSPWDGGTTNFIADLTYPVRRISHGIAATGHTVPFSVRSMSWRPDSSTGYSQCTLDTISSDNDNGPARRVQTNGDFEYGSLSYDAGNDWFYGYLGRRTSGAWDDLFYTGDDTGVRPIAGVTKLRIREVGSDILLDYNNGSGWVNLVTAVGAVVLTGGYDGAFVSSTSAGSTARIFKQWANFDVPPDPAITDVDSDETVYDGQTGATLTGTDLGTTNADRTLYMRQGAVRVDQTETGTGTSTAATFTASTGDQLKFGDVTFGVERAADSAVGELAGTLDVPSGQIYVDVDSPGSGDGYIETDPPAETGDQVQISGEGSAGADPAPDGLVVNPDLSASFEMGSDPAPFDVRLWDHNDSTWGDWQTITLAGDDVAITAGFDALVITEQQASVNARHAIGAGFDQLVISEQTAVVRLAKAIAASTDTLVITEQQAVVHMNKAVAAGADALVITEQQASINAKHAISAGFDQLTITEQVAAVRLARAVAAGADTIVLTENPAVVRVGTVIAAAADILTITEHAAAITLARAVAAAFDTLIITEHPAAITLGMAISAGMDSLLISEQQATVALSRRIGAGFDQLTISEQAALVGVATQIAAGVDQLLITEYQAVLALARAVVAGVDQLLVTEHAATIDSVLAIIYEVSDRFVAMAPQSRFNAQAPVSRFKATRH